MHSTELDKNSKDLRDNKLFYIATVYDQTNKMLFLS